MERTSWQPNLSISTIDILQDIRDQIDTVLEEELNRIFADSPYLKDAGLYMVHGGGKRIRPALVILSSYSCVGPFAIPVDRLLLAAAAVELLHTYSLIHDDLPCMDDDELRRGRPACHITFGVAAASWVGDALQIAAFELLNNAFLDSPFLEAAIGVLEERAGFSGMVGGQWFDLSWEGSIPTRQKIEQIHELKTAALISACCEIGGLAGNASPEERKLLRRYGILTGMAFQAIDDLIDLVGDSAVVGKATGKDLNAGKLTLAAVLDEREIQSYASDLLNEMSDISTTLQGTGSDALSRLAEYIIHRTK